MNQEFNPRQVCCSTMTLAYKIKNFIIADKVDEFLIEQEMPISCKFFSSHNQSTISKDKFTCASPLLPPKLIESNSPGLQMKIKRGPYHKYTSDDRLSAIRLFQRIGDYQRVSDATGIPVKNIKRWVMKGPERKKGGILIRRSPNQRP